MKKHLQIDHSFVLRNLIMNLKYQIFFYKKNISKLITVLFCKNNNVRVLFIKRHDAGL